MKKSEMGNKINPVCIELDKLQFDEKFSLIPYDWYPLITRNGKSYLLAISILADIMYWYRPIVKESKGIKTYKQKFEGDKLQKNYNQYAKLFKQSKLSIKKAVDFLIKNGFITREFRNISIWYGESPMLLTNVMYLEPTLQKLKCLAKPTKIINKIDVATFIEKFLTQDAANKQKANLHLAWNEINLITDEEDLQKIANYIQKLQYKIFLKTAYWRVVSHHVMHENKYTCKSCGVQSNLVIHHLTYDNHGYEHLYWEKDLICICDVCHKKIHNIKA
jgi:hypothetical protein